MSSISHAGRATPQVNSAPAYDTAGQQGPSLVMADAVVVQSRHHLEVVDAIISTLIAQSAPTSLIDAIRSAALAVEADLRVGVAPTFARQDELNTAIEAAGVWLYSPCNTAGVGGAGEIARTREILRDALRAARTPELSIQITNAIQMATALLNRQHGSAAEVAAWKQVATAAFAAVRESLFIVQGVS